MPEIKGVITILHFNDVYNVEEQQQEPVAGATRFCSALKSFGHLDPLILFSGDILAPSIMSTFTKGEQMIPVLNTCGVHCACYGNHDFDFGVDNLMEFARKTNFPWLISNVIDNGTSAPLADGKVTCILNKNGIKLGIIGLVEEEWLATLATIDPEDVTYIDFVTEGRKLARQLKDKENVDFVIALTHMRTPNDCRLAENVDEIDLILGGHDHVYEIKKVNGKMIIKSGTDFREFSKISLNFNTHPAEINVEKVEVTSKFSEDEELKEQLSVYRDIVAGKMDEVLGHFSTDLDARFSSIRTQETNIGNFIADVMLSSTHSDLALLNSGTLRADRILPKGDFTLRDLVNLLPMMDPMIVLNAPGENIYLALENSVSQYPKLEGRFPQVSGVSFAFDPKKPPGSRIDPRYIRIGDEYLDMNQKYRLATKMYMHQGRDGYDALKECEVLLNEEESPELRTAVQNHFESIKVVTGVVHHKSRHRQSLVCLSRRHSVVKMFEECSQSTPRAPLKRGVSLDAMAKRNLFKFQDKSSKTSIDKVEYEQCKMEPKVEARIVILTDEVKDQLERKRQEYIALTVDAVIEEDEENADQN
ncbi:trifunctional nucleotide phosphoesterase protein YfkN-like [Uloborus diversus]|uniref:trifunctional nucleotide phosphoesterase protein YfkN-like n=1 Tax=Uloborus diversus TaxID=327109 RepID=UPI0024091DEC|nr:trifunctional nucleotide phosphoesterase protein YfkN-like [Uloborus diversus]